MVNISLLAGITFVWSSCKPLAVQGGVPCRNSAWVNKKGKTCNWVAKVPRKRCKRKGIDKTVASSSCKEACTTCSCVNNSEWRKKNSTNDGTKGCDWVQKKWSQRCKKLGVDNTRAKHSCRLACGTCLRDETSPPTNAPVAPPPTNAPVSLSPTVKSVWNVWKYVEDSHTIENADNTCFESVERLKHTATKGIDGNPDYFTLNTDSYVDGAFRFGCKHKTNNICDQSCYPFDGTYPDWSDKSYLTFLAKIEGEFTTFCKPVMSLSGGGWPRKLSNKIILEDSYVDNGHLSTNEWRRVLIPFDDLETTAWDLTSVYAILFHKCGLEHKLDQPSYHISSLSVTNNAIELVSNAPSSSPSVYVTDDLLLATHRHVAHHWYPIFRPETEPLGNKWVYAENNSWPITQGSANPQTVTVLIPEDQTVIYSGADGIKYDKIIVKGSLTIQPINADVFLTATTIIVESGGVLDIKTEDDSLHTITIEIDGALDQTKDPQETMVGIVAWEGKLTITGNDVVTKMAGLSDVASVGTKLLKVDGVNLGFTLGGELVLPDTQTGLDVAHWSFPYNSGYVDQTEICTIVTIESSQLGETLITCDHELVYDHSVGSKIAYVTRSIKIFTSPSSTSRGHILHTGVGKFEVRNTRIENLGRTTTDVIDSTKIQPTELKFGPMMKQMEVTHVGTNQIARYALHAHHSKIEAYFTGNALLYSPRDGMVAHNSRVHITDNIIVGADGTGIFLEDSTETGPVVNNYIIGTGGGSRKGDDSRFGTELGRDMAHGGFGIWARGVLALIKNNHCEGHFGASPYAFFVHPRFVEDKPVPDVPGTPAILVGKSRHEIWQVTSGGTQLQSYGGFVGNTAVATFQNGIALSYFASTSDDEVGSIINGAHIQALGSSGRGISTTHSRIFTLNDVTIEGMVENNQLYGIYCGSCNNCQLVTPNTNLIFENVNVDRGGNC